MCKRKREFPAEKAAKTGLPLQEARIAVLRWKMVLQALHVRIKECRMKKEDIRD